VQAVGHKPLANGGNSGLHAADGVEIEHRQGIIRRNLHDDPAVIGKNLRALRVA
jgi:hypothetical protein